MKQSEAKFLAKKLGSSFPDGSASWNQEYATRLIEFLIEQDHGMGRKAIMHFAEGTEREKMPTIGMVNGKIREFQRLKSMEEAGRTDSSACGTCKGATWTKDPTGLIPCSQCRPETHKRWLTGDYSKDAPLVESELEGPSESHQQASRARINTGMPVSLERAMQWRDFMVSGDYKKHDYPEEGKTDYAE